MAERRKREPAGAQTHWSAPEPAETNACAPAVPTPTGPLLAASLGLVGLALLPLAGGGYSGAGYMVALVMLPLCAALGWPLLGTAAKLPPLLDSVSKLSPLRGW